MVANKTAKERFFQSCITGDLDTIKTDLFYNVSPFVQDKYGNNALHLTCMNNQPKVLAYILKTVKTFKNDIENKLGRTALNIAASQSAVQCIDILLNNLQCNVNSTDKSFKNTPLHWCVMSKCIKGVEYLLQYGADFKLVNKFGKTPLQLAKTTCLDIFHLINNFANNRTQDHATLETNRNIEFKNNPEPSTIPTRLKKTDEQERSKIFKTSATQQNINIEPPFGPDLTSNNSNDSFFLDISKLKNGDNSVLNLLEKSIEPVDETSFVSSILNSGKVIQLTEAGLLALEYTKNEVNTPIPDRLVKSFFSTSQQYNKNGNHFENDLSKNDDEKDSNDKGLKRLKSPQPCTKRTKYTKTCTRNSETKSLFDQMNSKCTKTVGQAHNVGSGCSQSSPSAENNEICSQNQLVCLNRDINTQPKWVEDLMCLFYKLKKSDIVVHK